MKLDQNPVFRKIIVPWYDSGPLCGIVLAVMVAVFLFALTGIDVIQARPEYHQHIWIPVLLVVMSGLVAVSISLRLIRRYLYRVDATKQEQYTGLQSD